MGIGSSLEFAPFGRTPVAGDQTARVSLRADRAPAIRGARVTPTPLAIENARLRAALQRERKQKAEVEETLRRMQCRLQQSLQLEPIGRLAVDIAHDFNGILGVILGFGEKAQTLAPQGTRLRQALDTVMTAGERGRALVGGILALCRGTSAARTAFSVEAVVRETVEMVSANLRPGMRIESRLEIGQAAMLGDPTQLHRIVMNLVTNALQAMTDGTLRVTLALELLLRPRAATTGPVAPGAYIMLTVADEGPGIPTEIIDRLFEPFFTTKTVDIGTGLGLSIVQSIVGGVGGGIDVESTLSAGTTFTVYLPRRAVLRPMGIPPRQLEQPPGR